MKVLYQVQAFWRPGRLFGRLMMEEKGVLVRIGGIPLWILRSDYQLPIFERGAGAIPTMSPLDAVFDHHWESGLEFTFVDIGAKYGLSTIVAANHIDGRGHNSPIVAFEPGAAADLIGRNLAVNHLADRVLLELVAVSDRSGEAVLYGEPDHPEDNHLIRRNVDRPFVTKVVPTISLDGYAEGRGIEPPLVVKVDTQGAEWEVWAGMRRLIERGPVTVMTEFTPWTFEGRALPAQFLRSLMDRYAVINMHPKNMAGSFRDGLADVHLVQADSADAFTETVAASRCGWTDLLCIPRQLPGSSRLVDAVLRK
jgi:FkbM family methyltransferase